MVGNFPGYGQQLFSKKSDFNFRGDLLILIEKMIPGFTPRTVTNPIRSTLSENIDTNEVILVSVDFSNTPLFKYACVKFQIPFSLYSHAYFSCLHYIVCDICFRTQLALLPN